MTPKSQDFALTQSAPLGTIPTCSKNPPKSTPKGANPPLSARPTCDLTKPRGPK